MLDRFEEFADGLNHPEGVAWSPFDGHVWAGGEGGEFYRVSLEGHVELVGATGGSMLGIAVDGSGRVYACDAGKGEIARLHPATGTIETYARGVDGAEMAEPNVAAFGPDGSLYVTCSGEERTEIVRITPGGATETWSKELTAYPNGMVVTPDASSVLVIEAKAERVARIPILADGSAGSATTFAELPDTDADGLALDTEGHLWATLYRPDGLVRLSPTGEEVLRIDDHLASILEAPTNLAFVGERLDRAVVANVGGRHLLAIDLGVLGQPLHHPEVP
ncbi:MAG: SMP-30/gluconolactonase/LRE family protein [Actinomycetota bacterium]